MSREFLWTNSQLNYLQYFFLYGVEKGRRTEAFIGRLPGGKYALKALEHERHVRTIIGGYDRDLQKSLRELWRTRNSHTLAKHLDRFPQTD